MGSIPNILALILSQALYPEQQLFLFFFFLFLLSGLLYILRFGKEKKMSDLFNAVDHFSEKFQYSSKCGDTTGTI